MAHFSQEYKTTVCALASRLEGGKIDEIIVSLRGIGLYVDDPDDLEVYKPEQVVYAREDRHHYDHGAEDTRTVTIHSERVDSPNGQV